jgi:hypothetical protein
MNNQDNTRTQKPDLRTQPKPQDQSGGKKTSERDNPGYQPSNQRGQSDANQSSRH